MLESNFKNQNYTVIGINSLIEGDLTLFGDVIIHSKIKGTITVNDSGKIILERGSLVKGSINCQDIDVFGKVEGNINSTGTLAIRASANVSGTIKCTKLTVYPGAILNMEAHAEDDHKSL
jgi:cytoskeletal protein CcmA (bactofilin family)